MAKFMPAREEAQYARIIHDLDAIDADPVGFKWKNRNYVITNLKVGQGMRISLAYSKLVDLEMKISEGKEVSSVDLARAYYDVLSEVIPDITPSEILEMGQNRINMVLNLIARKLSGDPSLVEEIQKKKLQEQNEKKSVSNLFQKLRGFVLGTNGVTKTS